MVVLFKDLDLNWLKKSVINGLYLLTITLPRNKIDLNFINDSNFLLDPQIEYHLLKFKDIIILKRLVT